MKIILKILLFHLFIYVNVSYSKNIVVAESGGDFNNIQDALNVAVAGDTVLVRGKSGPYFEQITFPRSGNENDGHIVLKNYPNEHPIIDGKNFSHGTERPQGLVVINSKSYIKVIGFEIRNIVLSKRNILPSGIWLYGELNHVEILNNIIHTIHQTEDKSGAHGLAVYGTDSTTPISDILIDGNEIYNCKLGWSESLVLNGNVENFIVSNNIVHDNNNIAFDFIGHERVCPNPELDQARNGLVFGNIAYNIDSRGNQAYGDAANADGFYVDGGRDLIIERNLVYNCNIGIEIASEHSGKSTSGIIVRNNIVKENIVLGIAFGGYDDKRGSTDSCKIINNTLYKNNSENFNYGNTENFSFGAEILVQYYCTNNIVSNNIIYSKSNSPIIANNSNTGSDNIFNNNIYYSEENPKWSWGNATYSNFENYKTVSGQEENSIYTNPMLVDPNNDNYKLAKNSPAIDFGKIIESTVHGEFDYLGNTRITNKKIDVGALEVTGVAYHK
ncbi:MAG: choice-of-anchor Q domain-containing protein [Melioribacteraceae bacterium]